jgi:hypothetical protein
VILGAGMPMVRCLAKVVADRRTGHGLEMAPPGLAGLGEWRSRRGSKAGRSPITPELGYAKRLLFVSPEIILRRGVHRIRLPAPAEGAQSFQHLGIEGVAR